MQGWELIDTQWDVNAIITKALDVLERGINRYIVGCKSVCISASVRRCWN